LEIDEIWPRLHPEVVCQLLPVHRQFPMLKFFDPQRPAQKSVLEDPDAALGLAAPSLEFHKSFFFHPIFEPRRIHPARHFGAGVRRCIQGIKLETR